MCEKTELQLFEIPEWNIEELKKRVAKLNKKAVKVGCPSILISFHGETQHVHPEYADLVRLGLMAIEDAPHYVTHNIALLGEGPKLAGWKFIGTLDHNTLPGSVIVNTVPGEVVPKRFYHNDAVCDHCGKIRRRNETFVVQHESGEMKQVGRQCIRDFLGHDPQAILRLLSSIRKLYAEIESDEFCGYGGGYQDWTYNHERVLEVTSAIIRTYGWVSKALARDDFTKTATAQDVLAYFNPPRMGTKAYTEWQEWKDRILFNKEVDEEEAQNAMEWLVEQDGSTEYMHNLHMIAQADAVPTRLFGYWCSLVATYQKAMERLRAQEKTRKVSEYVGELKKRQEFDVEIIGISYIDSIYGTTKLHRMLDDGGRTLIWFASSGSDMERGRKYRIKGTVKKHEEYKGWKQTSLNRVAVIEELEQ